MAHTGLDAIEYIRDLIVAADTDALSSVFISVAPQSASFPMVVIDMIDRVEYPTQSSGSAVDQYRVQLNIMAKASGAKSAFKVTHEISQAIRSAISRITDTTTYSHDIDGIQEAGHFSDFDSDIQVQRVVDDYIIRVK